MSSTDSPGAGVAAAAAMRDPGGDGSLAAWALVTIVALLTLASSFGVNPYAFGTGDDAITIPFLKSFVDPALYPGDYLLGQRPFYYTYLWNALGLLHAHLGLGLPLMFFAVYEAAIAFTFLGLYRVANTLFGSPPAALLSLLFLLFARATLGGVSTIEPLLSTRAVATPLLLFAIDCCLRRRLMAAFLLMGVAYLVHPLTTHYVLAMLTVASVATARWRLTRPFIRAFAAFVAVASPVLVWKMRHSPASLHLFTADPVWLVGLRERSADHMFPFLWGWPVIAHVALTALVFAVAWPRRNPPREGRHRLVLWALVTALALCVIGVVGSEFFPAGIVFVIQPFRVFQFVDYFAMVYLAHFLYRRLAGSERRATVLIAVGLAALLLLGARRGVVAAAVVGSEFFPAGIVFVIQPFRVFQFVDYFVMVYLAHFLYRRLAGSERRATVLVAVGLAALLLLGARRGVVAAAVVAAAALVILWRRVRGSSLAAAPVCALVGGLACVAAASCYFMDVSAGEPTVSLVDDPTSPYLQVEAWARAHTDVRDGFIVPPYEVDAFRVYSERTVYAEFEDGGLMNANPEFGREWLRRMAMLGFSKPKDGRLDYAVDPVWARATFCGLERAQLLRIAREMHGSSRRVFLVWPSGQRRLPFPLRYHNDSYSVYEVAEAPFSITPGTHLSRRWTRSTPRSEPRDPSWYPALPRS